MVGNPDALFAGDGSVKLPLLTSVAITVAGKYGTCLTRQPTAERAEKVMEAVRPQVEQRGYAMEIRPNMRTKTWAVYLFQATPPVHE
jgi:hypothetical protein